MTKTDYNLLKRQKPLPERLSEDYQFSVGELLLSLEFDL